VSKHALLSAAVGICVTTVLGVLINQRGMFGPAAVGALMSLCSLLFLYIFLGNPSFINKMKVWLNEGIWRKLLAPIPLLAAYLVYYFSTGENTPIHILHMLVYLYIPTILIMIVPTGLPKLTIWDMLFVLAIWVPIDFRLIQQVWHWPLAQGAAAYLNTTGVCLTVILAVGIRQLDGVGYDFSLKITDWRNMNINLTLASIFVLPAGFLLNFLRWEPVDINILNIIGTFGGIMLAVAIPEELFFRGIIQNLLSKSIRNQNLALVLASIIFGIGHFNNAAYPGGPIPDWRYILFASIAGLFYGRCYIQAGQRILPAALIHTVMDTMWIHLFRGATQ